MYLCCCRITTSLQAESGTVRGRTAVPAGVQQAGATRHRDTVPACSPVRSHMVALGEASALTRLTGTQSSVGASAPTAATRHEGEVTGDQIVEVELPQSN